MHLPVALSTAVILTPRRAALKAEHNNLLEVLVRIQAPNAPTGHISERPPQAIALVLDRSGSMQGAPLAEAVKCAECVAASMRPSDSVSLVSFDHRVQRLWPAIPLGDGAGLRRALEGLYAGGNTNLHGGWKEGADSLTDVAGTGFKRVILLSDGRANEGLTERGAIVQECAELAARGVTTSTYGLGDGFNEDLMVAMARAGGGNPYYGETAEDLRGPFEQELELLANTCLRNVRLSLQVPDGVSAHMFKQVERVGDGWRLPDVAWGSEAWVVVNLKVPAGMAAPVGRLLPLLRVSVTAETPSGEPVELERSGLSVPVVSAGAFQGLPDDELVNRRLTELAAATALLQLRDAANRSEWDAVDRLLDEAIRQFAGNPWVAAMLDAMKQLAETRSRERMTKEALYNASNLSARLAAKDESVRFSVNMEAADLPSYLRRNPRAGKGGEPNY